MPKWYDKECEQLEEDYESGNITREELEEEMKELNRELRSAAEECAENAYNDYMF